MQMCRFKGLHDTWRGSHCSWLPAIHGKTSFIADLPNYYMAPSCIMILACISLVALGWELFWLTWVPVVVPFWVYPSDHPFLWSYFHFSHQFEVHVFTLWQFVHIFIGNQLIGFTNTDLHQILKEVFALANVQWIIVKTMESMTLHIGPNSPLGISLLLLFYY